MNLRPVTLAEARRFIADHHRHNEPPLTWRFGVGLEDADGVLVGVAMAGLPKARMSMDGYTLEVNRTCVIEGNPNANSMLYGAILRAAKALGYRRVYTYTLAEESGSSLRAVGFRTDEYLPVTESWERRNGDRWLGTATLFAERKMPLGPKVRWIWEAA